MYAWPLAQSMPPSKAHFVVETLLRDTEKHKRIHPAEKEVGGATNVLGVSRVRQISFFVLGKGIRL